MAVSIALFGDDRVVGPQDLRTAVDTALYERPGAMTRGRAPATSSGSAGPAGLVAIPMLRRCATPADLDAGHRARARPRCAPAVRGDAERRLGRGYRRELRPGGLPPLLAQAASDAGRPRRRWHRDPRGTARSPPGRPDGHPLATTTVDAATTSAPASEMRLVVADHRQVTDVGGPRRPSRTSPVTTPRSRGALGAGSALAVLSVAPATTR